MQRSNYGMMAHHSNPGSAFMPNQHGQPVIAIDGTSASGKSTLSETLATEYGAQRLEYSMFFRLIALHMLGTGFKPEPGAIPTTAQIDEAAQYAQSLTWDSLNQLKNDDRLRSIEVSRTAPFFSGLPEVLASTDHTIRTLIQASREKPVIVEGRTIGKYVFPEADVKFFVDATLAERGSRRAQALRAKDPTKHASLTDEEVATDLAARDAQDQTRAYQPTGFDPGVHTGLDTTHLSIAAVSTEAQRIIEAAVPHLATRHTQPSLRLTR